MHDWIRVRLVVILGSGFSLKSVFEKKKKGICQNLGNTFKNMKNHLYYFLEKYLIDDSPKNTFRENISNKNTSSRNTTKHTLRFIILFSNKRTFFHPSNLFEILSLIGSK